MRTAMRVKEIAGDLRSADAQSNSEELIRVLLRELHGAAAGPVPIAANHSGSLPESIREIRPSTEDACGPLEEILLDIDVDGCRYLLIRMPSMNPARSQLSPREREIVRMVAQGHANKIIADYLGISTWTVCTHMRRIFAKLGVGSRAAMVAKLLETGNARKPAARAGSIPFDSPVR